MNILLLLLFGCSAIKAEGLIDSFAAVDEMFEWIVDKFDDVVVVVYSTISSLTTCWSSENKWSPSKCRIASTIESRFCREDVVKMNDLKQIYDAISSFDNESMESGFNFKRILDISEIWKSFALKWRFYEGSEQLREMINSCSLFYKWSRVTQK